MNTRNRKNRKRKNGRVPFLKRKFLKIPVWVWLLLLVIGIFGSSGDDTTKQSNDAYIAPDETVIVASTELPIETVAAIVTTEPTTAPIITPEPIPEEASVPTNDVTQYVIKKGDNNDDVRQLQKRLIALGYLSGSADGDFGSNTEAAVIAYQKAAGLFVTGECDYSTYKSLTSNDAPAALVTTTAPKSVEIEAPYIGNKGTKKFHYADCASVKKMKSSNMVEISSRDEAISNNYVPCKNCKP